MKTSIPFFRSIALIFLITMPFLAAAGCAAENAPEDAVSQTAPSSELDGYSPRNFYEEPEAEEVSDAAFDADDGIVMRSASADRVVVGGAPGRAKSNAPSGGESKSEPAAFPGKPALPARGQDVGSDRLLEYKVYLRFATDDVLKSRSDLYAIVSRHGFLSNASTQSEGRLAVNANFRVRSADLYQVIDELKTLGQLESENVTVTDHTEQMVWQNRVARRERVRGARRKNAPATAKTWSQKEELISASEDRQDQADHEKWKINDRVAWANFSVQLIGPDAPAKVEVPRFRNAFVGMLSLLLQLIYGLIYIAPLLLLAFGLVYGFRTWRARRRAAAGE